MTNVIINRDLCTGCKACVNMCPRQILKIDKESNKCICINDNNCDRLGGCVQICPTKAINIK